MKEKKAKKSSLVRAKLNRIPRKEISLHFFMYFAVETKREGKGERERDEEKKSLGNPKNVRAGHSFMHEWSPPFMARP